MGNEWGRTKTEIGFFTTESIKAVRSHLSLLFCVIFFFIRHLLPFCLLAHKFKYGCIISLFLVFSVVLKSNYMKNIQVSGFFIRSRLVLIGFVTTFGPFPCISFATWFPSVPFLFYFFFSVLFWYGFVLMILFL